MRLRIVKRIQGEVDGIPLNQFHVGNTYDVGTTLGGYLLVLGAAVPVIDDRPVYAIPTDLGAVRRNAHPRRPKRAPRKAR